MRNVVKCDGPHVADHAYVGVIRMSPGLQVGTSSHCDGLCEGHGDTRGYSHLRILLKNGSTMFGTSGTPVNYGCWFFTASNASGFSGAYVNVGKSLRVNTRCDAHEILYGSRSSGNALCTYSPGDRYWCTMARDKGFDSIQIRRGISYYPGSRKRKPWSELVVCTDECARWTYRHTACVPIARAIDERTSEVKSCDCPANASLLSCDGIRRVGPKGMREPLPLRVPGDNLPAANSFCDGSVYDTQNTISPISPVVISSSNH